jgi:hypothetical protein
MRAPHQWAANDNAKLAFGYDRPVTAKQASTRRACKFWYAKGMPDARYGHSIATHAAHRRFSQK